MPNLLRSRKLRISAVILGVLANVAWLVGLTYRQHQLRDDLENQKWIAAIADANQEQLDPVQPTVGVIQFLKSGYSITFDTVDYTPAGLRLTGQIGNPKSLSLSGLTLKIDAYRPAYQVRTEKKVDVFDLYLRKPLAVGQASVGYLLSGGQERFGLTLASLVQTKSDSVQLSVSFTGARYSYLH